MQAQWSLIGRIAGLASVRLMMVAAGLGNRMRMAHVSVGTTGMFWTGMFWTSMHMGLSMVSPQRHGANTGDDQCYPSSELS